MSKDHNRKARLLGTSFGAANGRLRKALLFEFAGRLGLTNCYRCGIEIDDIDAFSVEHMEDWMGSADPVKTFFDLDNIAFSHRRCNSAAANKPGKKYASPAEYKKVGWDRYYARNSEQVLSRKRERHRRNKQTHGGRSSTVE